MFVQLSIHHPRPDSQESLVDSMHRFGAALKGAPGLISVHTLHDAGADVLVGLAIWSSRESMKESAHLAQAAVEDDSFDEWEDVEPTSYRLIEV